jgi:hypothetical protein
MTNDNVGTAPDFRFHHDVFMADPGSIVHPTATEAICRSDH